MTSNLPPEIRVETVRDDVSYQLPVRPLGKIRLAGIFPIGFGILFVSMPVRVLMETLHGLASRNAGGRGGPPIFFALFVIPFLLAGMVPIAIGLALMFGRCRVEWRDKRLSTVEQVGPFWRRRRLMAFKSSIRKLTVSAGTTRVNGRPVTSGMLANMAAMTAEFNSGKPRIVAAGYPRNWLQALAEDLSARVGATSSLPQPPTVEVIDDAGRVLTPLAPEVVPRPPDTKVRIDTSANGISMVVPPANPWKASKGLLSFAILWCGFMAVMTCAMAFSAHNERRHAPPPWQVWLFLAGFWTIGLGMLASAINMGKRRALLLVGNGHLKVAYSGIWGTKQWDWPRESIAAIRADASGMEVNHRPVIELQVHPAGGKKVGLFGGRNEDELRWMAFELRRALGAPAYAGEPVAQQTAVPNM